MYPTYCATSICPITGLMGKCISFIVLKFSHLAVSSCAYYSGALIYFNMTP